MVEKWLLDMIGVAAHHQCGGRQPLPGSGTTQGAGVIGVQEMAEQQRAKLMFSRGARCGSCPRPKQVELALGPSDGAASAAR